MSTPGAPHLGIASSQPCWMAGPGPTALVVPRTEPPGTGLAVLRDRAGSARDEEGAAEAEAWLEGSSGEEDAAGKQQVGVGCVAEVEHVLRFLQAESPGLTSKHLALRRLVRTACSVSIPHGMDHDHARGEGYGRCCSIDTQDAQDLYS